MCSLLHGEGYLVSKKSVTAWNSIFNYCKTLLKKIILSLSSLCVSLDYSAHIHPLTLSMWTKSSMGHWQRWFEGGSKCTHMLGLLSCTSVFVRNSTSLKAAAPSDWAPEWKHMEQIWPHSMWRNQTEGDKMQISHEPSPDQSTIRWSRDT